MVYLKTESDMDQLITNGANIMYLFQRKIKMELKKLLTLQPNAPTIPVLIALQHYMIIDEISTQKKEKANMYFNAKKYPSQFLNLFRVR